MIAPDKPIKRMSLYLLMRNRAGRALFKQPRFGVLASDGFLRFDGIATEQAIPPEEGFLIRDVAQNSGFTAIGTEAMGVRLTAKSTRSAGVTFYDVTLQELTGQDRALTLV